MSLTAQLKDPKSRTRGFFEAQLPNLDGVRSRIREAGRPTIIPPSDEKPPWAAIGTAFDYRFRYFFGITDPAEFAAARGARRRTNDPLAYRELAAELERFLRSSSPVGRALDASDEATLARFCFVLALYESLDRAGAHPGPLDHLGPFASVEAQLALAPEVAVADLCALAHETATQHTELIQRRPAVLNPTFGRGAVLVGGADADILVDGCLLEIKTTKGTKLERAWA